MRSSGCAALPAIVLATCCGAPASSATIKSVPNQGGVTIQISGQIAAGDADAFIIAVEQATAAGRTIENVQLNSAGGKLVEATKLAAAIRARKISTSVGRDTVCASACFLVFAAGDRKFADTGAQIGVHKVSDKGGRETMLSGAATVSMAHFAKDLGVPSAIIDRMVLTPPRQIAWLNAHDLRSMGVTMAKPPAQERQAPADRRSAEQIPQELASLAALTPQARAASTNASSWNEFIDKVAKISAEQNDGNATVSRLCQPEFNNCVLGLTYLLKDGRQGLAVIIQDLHGKTMRREVCEFSNSNDVRDCVDWDSGAKHRDEKSADGDWAQIARQ